MVRIKQFCAADWTDDDRRQVHPGIYISFQAARPHCQTSTAEFDAAIDEAVSILEKRLIDIGEASPEQVQAERDANFAMWQDGGILASQTEAACQSSDPVKWGMTAEAVREVIKAVQVARPGSFRTIACSFQYVRRAPLTQRLGWHETQRDQHADRTQHADEAGGEESGAAEVDYEPAEGGQ